MKNILVDISTKDERKVKRTINVNIGFIGILLTAGILFTILLLNSSVISVASGSSPASDNNAITTPTPDQTLSASATH